jgi:hypothetical protein
MKHCHDLIRIRVWGGSFRDGKFGRISTRVGGIRAAEYTRNAGTPPKCNVHRWQAGLRLLRRAISLIVSRSIIFRKSVIAILHAADASVANCESAPVDFTMNHILSMGAGGQAADPSVARDFKELGFNLVGRSNSSLNSRWSLL